MHLVLENSANADPKIGNAKGRLGTGTRCLGFRVNVDVVTRLKNQFAQSLLQSLSGLLKFGPDPFWPVTYDPVCAGAEKNIAQIKPRGRDRIGHHMMS